MRRLALEDLVDSVTKSPAKRKPSISFQELIETNQDRVGAADEESPEEAQEEPPESAAENEGEEAVDLRDLVNNVRLTNLTRDRVRPVVGEHAPEFAEHKRPLGPMGYFCDSQLRRHSEWTRGCQKGYFEYYQSKLKRARKQETDLFDEHEDQQKLLMDVYFKEKVKMPRSVRVDSEMPLVPHLIQTLGLVFKRDKPPRPTALDEDEYFDSEEEAVGIRPRRRRHMIREERHAAPVRQPVIRRMMTRSRTRESALNRPVPADDSQEDSEEDIEIFRRRIRTRNKLRLDQVQVEEDGPKQVAAESSIGAKAGERRRKNIQRQMSLNGEHESMHVEAKMHAEGGKSQAESERAKETPGRVINTHEEDASKKRRFCFECSLEIECRKKKRKCCDCERLFHLDTCADLGLLVFNSDLVCLICFFNRKSRDKNFARPLEQKRYSLERLSRKSLGRSQKFQLDQETQTLHFELIEGDEIMLIPPMFKAFLRHYAAILPSAWAGQNLDLLMKADRDVRATVLDVSYELPRVRTKTEAEKFATRGQLNLFQVLRLRIEDSNVNELRTKHGLLPLPGIGSL